MSHLAQYLPVTISLRSIEVTGGEPLALEDARNFLRLDTDADDALVSELIAVARARAEGITRRVLRRSKWEWVLSGLDRPVEVPLSPCAACERVAISGAGVEDECADPSFYVFQPGGVAPIYGTLRPMPGFPDTALLENCRVTVTLSAGYADGECPDPIRQWMRVRVADMYEQRESHAMGVNFHEFRRDFVDGMLDPYRIVA